MDTQLAFVAGATGYTGREVVRRLREQGVDTVAHVRPDSPRLEQWKERFSTLGAVVDTTPFAPEALREALQKHGPSLVFALLGTTKARGRRAGSVSATAESYESVDYGLTSMLIEACGSVSPRPRFVYLSSLGVNERTRNAYLHARHRVETELRDSHIPFTIVRPSFISGPDRDESRPLERTSAVVAGGLLGLMSTLGAKNLPARFLPITASSLARELVRLAETASAEGQTIEAQDLRR